MYDKSKKLKLCNILTKEFLEKELIIHSVPEIANSLNCHSSTIYAQCKKFSIKRRKCDWLLGKKFGRLFVESHLGSDDKGNALWNCICDCGNTKVLRTTQLHGKTKSCGCLLSEITTTRLYTGGKYITGQEWSKYTRGAKIRNYEFAITIAMVEDLYEKQNKKCALSGVQLIWDTTPKNGDQDKKGHKRIKYGNASIDRINSKVGYIENNIQIVDKHVNLAKHSLSDYEFIQLCIRVAKHNAEN